MITVIGLDFLSIQQPEFHLSDGIYRYHTHVSTTNLLIVGLFDHLRISHNLTIFNFLLTPVYTKLCHLIFPSRL